MAMTMTLSFNRDVSAAGRAKDGRIVQRDFDKYDELPIAAATPSRECDDMTLVTLVDGTCFPLVTEDIEISQ